MPIWKIDLSWIAAQMGLLPCRTFCECAVGPMEISVAPGFKGKCSSMLLVEPNVKLAGAAATALKEHIIHAAIDFKSGSQLLVDNGGSSFLSGTWAPTQPPNSYDMQIVKTITFDAIDDGMIDILALDCEGMEWAVLSKMKSVPKLLTIEIWDRNPYRMQIENWLNYMGYTLRFSTGPTAETHLYTL